MQLLYHHDKIGNFGDDLNGWLWERLLPGQWNPNDDVAMSGIGTIINAQDIRRILPHVRAWIVFSSGVGYGSLPRSMDDPKWHIVSVRGPLSAQVLGLSADKAVTDGALLLRLLPEYTPLPESERSGVVFMPHHKALPDGNWKAVCDRAGLGYIDPTADGRDTIERLRSARLVLADAMHGAIVADALRVPWIPIVASPEINTFKWLDWTLSLDLPYAPTEIPPSSVMELLRHRQIGLVNIRFAMRQRTTAAVREYYQRRVFSEDRLWRLRKSARYLSSRGVTFIKRMMTSPVMSRWYSSLNERQLDQSAAALQAAAERPGYLSNDGIFEQRLSQMASKLDAVRRLAEELSD